MSRRSPNESYKLRIRTLYTFPSLNRVFILFLLFSNHFVFSEVYVCFILSVLLCSTKIIVFLYFYERDSFDVFFFQFFYLFSLLYGNLKDFNSLKTNFSFGLFDYKGKTDPSN